MNNKYFKCCGAFLMLMFFSVTGFSQTTITGTVVDARGALQGVTVLVKETNFMTQTDLKGHYSVSAAEGQTIRISLIGYVNREILVGKSNVLNVTLVPGENELQEVVVTGMGIKREKKSLGYAATSISSESLTDLGSPVNALTTMYGQVPGLRVSATALGPSGGLNINIRNAVAFSESSNVRPLFVIDGIPMLDWQTDINRNPGNGLNDLNMDDIASFEILRGAKASLLYGSQGANGVILITSKSGKKRPGYGIDVNLSHQFDSPWIQQEFQNEFGSGYPIHWNAYGPNFTNDGFWTRDGQEAYVPLPVNFGPRFDGRDILYYDNQIRPYEAQPNNVRDLYRTGHTSVANISIQGGGDLGGFRLAYTNKDYKGIFEGFNMKDNNVTFNGNMSITDRVNLQMVSTYSQTVNTNSPGRNQNALVTFGIPRNLDVLQLRNEIVDPATGYSYWRVEDRSVTMNPGGVVLADLAENYFFAQNQDRHVNTRNHFRNSLMLDIKLTDVLSINSIGGFDWILNDLDVNRVLRAPLSVARGGENRMTNSQNIRWNAQSMLRYERPLRNPDFDFSGFVGFVYQSISDRSLTRRTNGGFLVRDWSSLENSFNPLLFSDSSLGDDQLYAVFGSAQLSYKDYLFFDFQARNDWSSILPPNNNSYFYPGTSVSWVFSETLQNKPSWLSMGKVRASWADVGRPGPRYFANDVFNIEVYSPGIIAVQSPGRIPALNLRPERKREFEVGFDSYFFNNRIGVEASVFSAKTYDQIMPLSLAPSSGYNAVGVNAGLIQTTGYEFMINAFPIKTRDFSWNLILNGSASTPMVRRLDLGITTQNLWGAEGARVVAEEGQPYGQIKVNPYARDANGNLLVNASGLYFIDGSQEKVVGKIVPDFVGGIISNFQYKGLVLGVNIDSQFGSTLISQTNMYMRGNGSSTETLFGRDESLGGLPYYISASNGQRVLLESHTSAVPADSRFPMIFHDGIILPGVKQDGSPNDILTSAPDRYAYFWRPFLDIQEDVVYKNDYIKLRNITLSYALPKSVTSRMKFERLVLTGFVNNIAFLYRTLPNVDPESFNGTNVFFENNGFPSTRSYGMSIRAAF